MQKRGGTKLVLGEGGRGKKTPMVRAGRGAIGFTAPEGDEASGFVGAGGAKNSLGEGKKTIWVDLKDDILDRDVPNLKVRSGTRVLGSAFQEKKKQEEFGGLRRRSLTLERRGRTYQTGRTRCERKVG